MDAVPEIIAIRGDLTEQECDAIVNAANSSLMGGGGVDGAIHRVGGPSILEECRRIRETRYPHGLPVGDAVATNGGLLPARFVIHTVGPVYAEFDDPTPFLAACHISCLGVADELGAGTVAFPAISTGAYGYPVREAAPVAVAAVRDATTTVREVHFVLFGDDAYDAFSAAIETGAGA